MILPPPPSPFADTIPAPPMFCEHHILSHDGSFCLRCGDELTLEIDADTVAEAVGL